MSALGCPGGCKCGGNCGGHHGLGALTTGRTVLFLALGAGLVYVLRRR